MPDISQITMPSGTTYNIKDEVARSAAAAGLSIVKVDSLPTASASTLGGIYLLANSQGEGNNFDEYLTVKDGSNYAWEKIGSTDVDLSGYSEDGHTHNVTSNVTVSQHTGVLTGGSVSSTFTGDEATVSVKGTPSGTISGTAVDVNTKNASGGAITVYSMSSAGSKTNGSYTASSYTPETYTVTGETLVITSSSYTPEQVTLPTVTLPSRTQVVFSTTVTDGTFAGNELTSSGKYTPTGGVTSTFTPTTGSLTHSVTNNTVTSTTNSK